MKNSNPFKVPENYFDNLNDRVQERITQENSPEKVTWMQTLKPYMWLAACAVGIMFFAKIVFTTSISSDYKIQPANQITAVQNISNKDTLSSDEIIEYLTDKNIDDDILLASLND